ncbi:hypothetical protein D3C80_1073320 [compost metagenome]
MQYDHYAIIYAIATVFLGLMVAVEVNSGQRQSVETPLLHHSNLVGENDPDTGFARGGQTAFQPSSCPHVGADTILIPWC